MSTDAINAAIIEYSLDDRQPENLAIACGICQSFAEIQKRAILKFLDNLKPALRSEIGDKLIVAEEIRERPLNGKDPIFAIGKPEWGIERPPLGIGSNPSGSGVYIGLWKERLPGLRDEDEKKLWEKLASRGDRVRGHDSPWAAWCYVKKPYDDWSWNSPQALNDLYFNPKLVVDRLQELILWWVAAVSSVVARGDSQ